MNITTFLQKSLKWGLEAFQLYYGVYAGTVTRNDDPEERGRIQAHMAPMQRKALDVWIDPAMAGAGTDRGHFHPPNVGDSIWCWFRCGNSSRPHVYMGGWYGEDDLPNEFRYVDKVPQRQGTVTRMGHSLVFNDETGQETVRMVWHKPEAGDPALSDATLSASRTAGEFSMIGMESNGSIQFANKVGDRIDLDASQGCILLLNSSGNSVVIDSKGVTVSDKDGNHVSVAGGSINVITKTAVNLSAGTVNLQAGGVFLGQGAALKAVLGEILVQYLSTHTHGTGTGPSSPPLQTPPPTMLSQKVKLA